MNQTSPAILIGVHCRQCRALIPLSIADKMGSEENQYLCERCQAASFEKLHDLSARTDEFWQKEIYMDMGDQIAPPCEICLTIEGDERVFDEYEGKLAFMCKPCSQKYLRKNRDKIRGTLLEWDLKLR